MIFVEVEVEVVISYTFIQFSIKFVVVIKICKAWVRSQLRLAWNWL